MRRSQSMVQEEDRGQPPDEEQMSRSQGSSTAPVLDKDSAAPKSRLAEQSAGPSGKSRSSRPADGSWWSRWCCRS